MVFCLRRELVRSVRTFSLLAMVAVAPLPLSKGRGASSVGEVEAVVEVEDWSTVLTLLRLSRKEEEGAISVLVCGGGEEDLVEELTDLVGDATAFLTGTGDDRGPKSIVEERTKSAW